VESVINYLKDEITHVKKGRKRSIERTKTSFEEKYFKNPYQN
jgi:hypothetical protein